jgi:hypothetical protein
MRRVGLLDLDGRKVPGLLGQVGRGLLCRMGSVRSRGRGMGLKGLGRVGLWGRRHRGVECSRRSGLGLWSSCRWGSRLRGKRLWGLRARDERQQGLRFQGKSPWALRLRGRRLLRLGVRGKRRLGLVRWGTGLRLGGRRLGVGGRTKKLVGRRMTVGTTTRTAWWIGPRVGTFSGLG